MSATGLSAGTWYHMAVTYNGTNWVMFLDGNLIGSSVAGIGGQSKTNIFLGNGYPTFWNGAMDEVRIWDMALTQSEIQAHMNCEIPGAQTNLIANYHFNQGVASSNNTSPAINTLPDASGNNNTGALNNFALNGSISNWIAPSAIVSGTSCTQTFYADADADGYGNPTVTQTASSQPTGFVLNNTDCDDTHNTVYPVAPEICDGLDNDCDGIIDSIAGIPICPATITLNIQVFLEGLYTGANSMRASLYDLALSSNPTETDTITVNLWASANVTNAAPDHSIKTIVHTNGEASVDIPAVVSGNPYYVVVKHRNHIETWSKLPISFSTNTINYFFDSPDKAFNNNLLLQADGKYVIYGGDVNQDGVVDQNDIDNIHNAANTFTTGYLSADANGDGIMDALDMIMTDNNAAGFIVKITP
jgi:hypothetical protein